MTLKMILMIHAILTYLNGETPITLEQETFLNKNNMNNSINSTTSPSPVGVQAKESVTRHAGLLSIKAANTWIEESIKRPDPKMYFHNLIVQYENTVIFAASDVGKSILATQVAEDISKTEKVLYVDLELSSKQFLY